MLNKKTGKLRGKIENMEKRVGDIKETCQYFVKVADSCPLAIEQQRL